MLSKLKVGMTLMVLQIGSVHALDQFDNCEDLVQESNEIEHLLYRQGLSNGEESGRSSGSLQFIDPESVGPRLSDRQVQDLESQLDGLSAKLAVSLCDAGGSGGGGSSGGNNGPSSTRTITVTCESWDYDAETCKLPRNIYNVTLVQQLSNASCDGRFYASGDTLHVNNGCRGVFSAFLSSPVYVSHFACESWGYSYAACGFPFPGPQTVWLKQRNSNSRCEEGTTWGLSGVPPMWVNHGCRGVFSSAQ